MPKTYKEALMSERPRSFSGRNIQRGMTFLRKSSHSSIATSQKQTPLMPFSSINDKVLRDTVLTPKHNNHYLQRMPFSSVSDEEITEEVLTPMDKNNLLSTLPFFNTDDEQFAISNSNDPDFKMITKGELPKEKESSGFRFIEKDEANRDSNNSCSIM